MSEVVNLAAGIVPLGTKPANSFLRPRILEPSHWDLRYSAAAGGRDYPGDVYSNLGEGGSDPVNGQIIQRNASALGMRLTPDAAGVARIFASFSVSGYYLNASVKLWFYIALFNVQPIGSDGNMGLVDRQFVGQHRQIAVGDHFGVSGSTMISVALQAAGDYWVTAQVLPFGNVWRMDFNDALVLSGFAP